MSKHFVLMILLFAFAGCQPQQISLNSKHAVGSSFPNLEGTDLHGQPISIADFKGKVILVDFFGDW
jgi:cytochrome oxidase Cu insertion factor (SCO1/SenC/PrrC family)